MPWTNMAVKIGQGMCVIHQRRRKRLNNINDKCRQKHMLIANVTKPPFNPRAKCMGCYTFRELKSMIEWNGFPWHNFSITSGKGAAYCVNKHVDTSQMEKWCPYRLVVIATSLFPEVSGSIPGKKRRFQLYACLPRFLDHLVVLEVPGFTT